MEIFRDLLSSVGHEMHIEITSGVKPPASMLELAFSTRQNVRENSSVPLRLSLITISVADNGSSPAPASRQLLRSLGRKVPDDFNDARPIQDGLKIERTGLESHTLLVELLRSFWWRA